MQDKQDTICAVSTPAGVGGIAVVRVSGKDAFEICDKIFRAKNGKKLAETVANTVVFGEIVAVDEVLVSVFRAPHSFTGDDVVEISCHGSLFIQQEILKLLLENGCRLARAGEFTQRAFLNGKMDLSQAEAVADLIASTSAAAHAMALNQMRGGFSAELADLRAKLLQFTSLVELELDFGEEDVEFADRRELKNLAETITQKISRLIHSFAVGNVLKNGIPVAIVGETNVGKSTLLNALLNEEKAIVSNIHGTTRDVIEDTISLGGITFRFIDTAGIRQTQDEIETIGIERTFHKMQQASMVLLLLDATEEMAHIEDFILEQLPKTEGKKLIVVFNKTDLILPEKREELERLALPLDVISAFISAKERDIDVLQHMLLDMAQTPSLTASDVIVTNARHYEALTNAFAALNRVNDGLQRGISGDFISQDIREVMHYLGEITGEISTDEVLGNIFAKFCIGK